MHRTFYIVTVVLVVLWALGFLQFHIGYFIHVLLIFAVISVLFGIIQSGKNP
jgi:Family of unknown function (DUF5670)